MNYQDIKAELEKLIDSTYNPTKVFKTGVGEYAEGDQFICIRVPVLRKFASELKNLDYVVLTQLFQSVVNEERQLALFILTKRYQKDETAYQFYLNNIDRINNWNLVDSSAHLILGVHTLKYNNFDLLFDFAKSDNLWKRRIAIVATMAMIKENKFDITLKIADMLLSDANNLIHKATGWMLREIYARNKQIIENYIEQNAAKMPRTMLRYAIEKMPSEKRKNILTRKYK